MQKDAFMGKVKFAFEDLKVYEKVLDFINTVYAASATFPRKETIGLTSQFVRAATSIALNIAEGAGNSDAQFNRFLQIAKNSVKECVVCAEISRRQNYISLDHENTMRVTLQELSKMITALQKYLKKSTNDQRLPTKDF